MPKEQAGLGDVFLQPRQVADLAYRHGINDFYDLATCVAICKAESQFGVHAWHDNLDVNGKIMSRDVGLFQINIPASQVGTQAEKDLYLPDRNAAAMYSLFSRRRWQPWATYNSGAYLAARYAGFASLAVCNLAAWRFHDQGSPLPVTLFTLKDLQNKLPS